MRAQFEKPDLFNQQDDIIDAIYRVSTSTTCFACDNCDWSSPDYADLNEIRHYSQRVDVGGTVPAGECPACGALAYLR